MSNVVSVVATEMLLNMQEIVTHGWGQMYKPYFHSRSVLIPLSTQTRRDGNNVYKSYLKNVYFTPCVPYTQSFESD